MKKLMPYLLTCVTVLCFVLNPAKVKASHAAGGEIIYEWISDSTYRVFFKFYRDCTGTTAPTSQPLCYSNSCNTTVYQTTMAVYPGLIPPGVTNGSPVSLGCSNSETNCTNSSSPIPGYHEWWYYADVTLPFECNFWTFFTYVNARNPSNNLAGSTGLTFYTETTFNNLGYQGNNSPYFSNKPVPYVCVNTPYQFNNGAVDPNGDSLVSDVLNPLNGGSCQTLPTPAPLNNPQPNPYPNISIPGNPIQTGNTFALNAATGQISFTAPLVGTQTLSIRTREYRNGVLIGSILRDVQVQVIGNCSTVSPTYAPIITVPGVVIVNGQIQGCAGQLLQFGFDLKTSHPTGVLIGEDNHLSSIPAAAVNYTGQKTDSVRGSFSWTPGINQSGLFTMTVTVKDSTCDPPGIMYSTIFTIPIFVWPATRASNDTSVCPGEPVQLAVNGGGNFVWNTISGPSNTLNNPNSQFPISSSYANVSYQVVSQQTAFCTKNKDTVNITMLPSPDFTPVADILTCPGVTKQMDLQLVPMPGVNYTVKWSPGTYLSSSTIPNPTVTPQGDMTYTIVIGATNNSCKGFDTVNVEVLDGFDVTNNDTAICEGQSIQVTTTGDTRYSYNWTTNDLSGGASISDPAINNPVITPTSVGTWTYTLTGSFAGCNDSTATFKIDVQPIPTVTLPADAAMCHNDTMQLSSIVTPAYTYTYNWTPGTVLNNAAIPNPIFKALATTTLTLTVSTSAGCKDDDDILLTVFPADFVFASNDTNICPRDTAYLSSTGLGLKSFYWGPAQTISDINTSVPYVWPDNSQMYYVYARDTNGCFDTAEVRVTVKPAASIDLPKEVLIYPGESYQMAPKGNGLHYSWFPPAGLSDDDIANPVAKPQVNTRYFVKATTEYNCTVTDSIDVLVSPDSKINMPNAFTPGRNSKLKILHLGEAKLKSYIIFNRWGLKVFETSNIDEGWDGTYNGEPQPLGTYIYTIEAETFTGRKVSRQGNVTLIR